MSERILITGGAGFIGSHLADELLAHGFEVRVLDNLLPQVHGPMPGSAAASSPGPGPGDASPGASPGDRDASPGDDGIRARGREAGDRADGAPRPAYLHPAVELMVGDVRDRDRVQQALRGVDAVVHLAAMVGVGQSMYRMAEYTSANSLGTAVLLEALVEQPVRRLVVASSMSVYGEGLYRDARDGYHERVQRSRARLAAGDWEPRDNRGLPLLPVPTPESKRPCLSSIYALTKYDQEQQCLLVGQAYGIPTVALRFFNVYGSRQALSNPYTGVLAIFAARYLDDRPPLIFEDGLQKRDFVHVRDVARACRLALDAPEAPGHAINVGSGRAHTIREVAAHMAEALGRQHIAPEISHEHRVGDIRHCVADVSLAKRLLGYEPEIELSQGLAELVAWIQGPGAPGQSPSRLPDQSADQLADQSPDQGPNQAPGHQKDRINGQAADPGARAREELIARGLTL